MALIEGIGDDVITLVFILFTIVIIIISWLSTSVREFAFPANLLVIERRSRRLYTANINGNLSRSKLNSAQSQLNIGDIKFSINFQFFNLNNFGREKNRRKLKM